ncbi:S-layer homology domain-containing protein [Paenibacillus sp. PAMC21692]|uniref:S-layer homology domain-containing protein n=1 Tax=Paenibacillus sp. PAMC21692 TaxID=2762320 RepID=UPI00164DB99B|nr:S-layer homology domain-containing protein [Paenibacillus sp. PAMC21692]QNK58953.1 S-layer homology domain-containing protein [Paenibacillus sp. PAMC21692]
MRSLRVRIVCLAIILLCMPKMFPAAANAKAAPEYLLDANKPVNGQVTLTLSGKSLANLYGYEASFSFEPDKLELVEAKSNLEGFSITPIIKNNEIIIAHTKIGNVPGENGDLVINTLKFKLKKHGDAMVKWETMKTVTDQLKSTTTAVGQSVTVSKTFIDLTGHWAQADIEWLAARGIIEGVDDNHFKPNDKVTRAQFAAMIARALNLKETAARSPFTDVPSDSWYADVVSSIYAAKIIKGKKDGTFAPQQKISREEMTVMLVRAGRFLAEDAFKETDSAGGVSFADVNDISKWAIKDVELALHSGLIYGTTKATFAAKSQSTRAEAAVVIKRLLTKINGE